MFQRTIVMNSAHSIVRATRDYEAWLVSQVRVVRPGLQAKHKLMAEDGFSFLRATFYRWAQLFPALFPKLARAPKVLGVGDLQRRELRHLARRRGPTGLGHQRFR